MAGCRLRGADAQEVLGEDAQRVHAQHEVRQAAVRC